MIGARTGRDGKPYGIGFAVALPRSWNGRFLFQGGGGLNGSVAPPLGAQYAGDQSALQRGFVDTIDETFGRRTAADRFANEALVALISSLVTARLAAGDVDGLSALHRPLMQYVRRVYPS